MSSSESASEDGDVDLLHDSISRHNSEVFEDACGGLQASTACQNVEWIVEKSEHRDPELPEPEPGEGDEGAEEPAPGDEAETPAERTESTSEEPPEEAPGEEPREEPSTEDPAEAPPVEPEVPLLEGPAEAPAEEPAETPDDGTAETTAQGLADAVAEEAVEQPAEAPAEEPAEEPAEAPAEVSAEAPAEESAEAPASANEPADAPADDPDEAPPDEPDEAPADAPPEEPEEPPAEVAEEPPAEEPPPEEPADAPSEEPPPEEPSPEEPTGEESPEEPTDAPPEDAPTEDAQPAEAADGAGEQEGEMVGGRESFIRSSAQALQDAVNLGRAGLGHVSAVIIENLPRAEEARTTGGLMLACLSPLSDVQPEDLARQLHEDAASAYAGLLSLLIVMLMTGRSRAMGCAVSMWLSGLAVIHVMVRTVLSDTAVGATMAYCSPPIIVASILSWATGVRGAHAAPLASLAAAWSSLAASRVFVRMSGENSKSRPLILVCGVIFCTLAALSVL